MAGTRECRSEYRTLVGKPTGKWPLEDLGIIVDARRMMMVLKMM